LFQAGDQLTWLSGWQEGAILTAKQAVGDIVRRTGPG
jgi:monoamine oxidase